MVILYGYLNKLSIDTKIVYVSAYNRVWQKHMSLVLGRTIITNLLSVPYGIAK